MPAKSEKQEKFMQAVAHSPTFAKKAGVPQSVGKEFTKSGGGEMKESKAMVKKEVSFMKKKGAPKSMIKHEMAEAGMKKGGVKKMALGGMGGMGGIRKVSNAAPPKGSSAMPRPRPVPPPPGPRPRPVPPPPGPRPRPVPPPPGLSRPQNPSAPTQSQMQAAARQQAAKQAALQIRERGAARAFADYQKQKAGVMGQGPQTAKKMASGGLAAGHKEADGIAKKGKTRAMQVKMAGGGKTKKYC